jgi:hypothetical protein
MLHRNLAVGVIAVRSPQPLALSALAASLIVHAVMAALLLWNADDSEPEDEPDMVVDVDLDIAPPAPEGFDPIDPSTTTLVEEEPAGDTAVTEEADPDDTTLEPEPEQPEQEAETAAKDEGEDEDEDEDGEEDEQEDEDDEDGEDELARKDGPPDAGPDSQAATDAGAVASAPDAGTAPMPSFADRAAAIAREGSSSSIASDLAPRGEARPGAPGSPSRPIKLPPGASADLRVYAPEGDKLAVLLRYDRLKGTPWAPLADAIIAPMPDYRSIVGNRKVALADLFQSLLISTRNPTNVRATHLIARTHMSPAEVRRFLDHPLQPVTWSAVRGGALGERQDSPLKVERDRRVYLIPQPGLVVLTRPKFLGALVEKTPPAGSAPADLDGARAAPADVPPWLARAWSAENEAGVESSVVAVVTVGGIRRAELEVPEFGALPTPVRFSLALEMAKIGFYVRGTLAFATPQLAQQFEARMNQGRERVLGNRFTQLMLRNFHALNALQGLTLRRRGQLVTYATSISNADAKAGMRLAADWARRFFEGGLQPLGPPGAPPDRAGHSVPGSTVPSSPSSEAGTRPRSEPGAASSTSPPRSSTTSPGSASAPAATPP